MTLAVKNAAGENKNLKTTEDAGEHVSHHIIDTFAVFGATANSPAAADDSNDTHMAFIKRMTAKLTDANTSLSSVIARLFDEGSEKSAAEILALILAEAVSIESKTVDHSTVLADIKTAAEAIQTAVETMSTNIALMKTELETQTGHLADIKTATEATSAVLADAHNVGAGTINTTVVS